MKKEGSQPSIKEDPQPFTNVELNFAMKITNKMMKNPLATFFLKPVDPIVDGAPDYNTRIKRPMDLGTIKNNLCNKSINTIEQWKEDMNLVWNNAMAYNPPGSPYFDIALELSRLFKEKTKYIPVTDVDEWNLQIKQKSNQIARITKEYLSTIEQYESKIIKTNSRIQLKPKDK